VDSVNFGQNLHCQWTVYKPAFALPDVPSSPMCAHPRKRDQTITGSIIDTGRWADCDSLTRILRDEAGATTRPVVHVEIGAHWFLHHASSLNNGCHHLCI
jgi:hypothetical protein